jgi:hypothetical protein
VSSKNFGREGEYIGLTKRLNQNFKEAQFQQKCNNKRKETPLPLHAPVTTKAAMFTAKARYVYTTTLLVGNVVGSK